MGLRNLSLEETAKLLREGEKESCGNIIQQKSYSVEEKRKAVESFIQQEQKSLNDLRSILTCGSNPSKLETLIDECGYLWAHFPECAGTEGRRPKAEDISFLKRVRAEIDPLLKRFAIALKEL